MSTCQFIKNYIENAAAIMGMYECVSSAEFTVRVKNMVFVIYPVVNGGKKLSFNSPDNNDDIVEIHVSDELSTESVAVQALCNTLTNIISAL